MHGQKNIKLTNYLLHPHQRTGPQLLYASGSFGSFDDELEKRGKSLQPAAPSTVDSRSASAGFSVAGSIACLLTVWK